MANCMKCDMAFAWGALKIKGLFQLGSAFPPLTHLAQGAESACVAMETHRAVKIRLRLHSLGKSASVHILEVSVRVKIDSDTPPSNSLPDGGKGENRPSPDRVVGELISRLLRKSAKLITRSNCQKAGHLSYLIQKLLLLIVENRRFIN